MQIKNVDYKKQLKELHEDLVRGYNTQIGTFFALFLNILVVSSLNGIELKGLGLVIEISICGLYFYSLIGLILEIPAYLSPEFDEYARKNFFKQETKGDYYYIHYRSLLLISFNTIILTPIIMMLIFNPSGTFSLSASIISTIDSDLMIAASILLVAVQFLEQSYLTKAKMFPQEYPKLVFPASNYLSNVIFTIIFAILSLEMVSQSMNIAVAVQKANINIAVNIAIGIMLLALYFVFSAFLDMLYVERLRYIEK